jgi:positive control factor
LRNLFYEYKQSLRDIRKLKRKLQCRNGLQAQEDIKIVNEIITDLEYVIEWINLGRNPDLNRGIDKKFVYLTDPNILDEFNVKPIYKISHREIPACEQEKIEDALCTLTEREREAFMLVKVEGITYENAGKLLGIKKTTVQTHVDRAEKKIEKRKNKSLFLVS